MLDRIPPTGPFLHPLHAVLLAFPVALFPSALASDVTYLNTEVMQWSHFSAWLIAGALLFGGLVLAWSLVLMFRGRRAGRRGWAALYLVALAIMWFAGLFNALLHSRDAWSSVGTTGLVLSIVCTVAALVAGWVGYSGAAVRETVR